MPSLYLLRHGLTAANLEDRFAGRGDEPLLPEGAEQLRGVAASLAGAGIAAICCGPLARTVQSAEVVAEIVAAPIKVVAELNEIRIPHWDGLSKSEIRQRFGEEYPTWLASPERFQAAGCETLAQVQARAVAAVARLCREHAGADLLLISHLIVLRILLLHGRQLPLADFRSLKIANGQVIVENTDAFVRHGR